MPGAERPSLEALLQGGGPIAVSSSPRTRSAHRGSAGVAGGRAVAELLHRLLPCGLSQSKPHPRWAAGCLGLADSGLEDDATRKLVDVLLESGAAASVSRLDLSGCRIGPDGCCAVARLLGAPACAVEYLDLSSNPLRGLGFSALRPGAQSVRAVDADRGVVALADAVLGNPCSMLAELRLQKCGLGAEGSRALRRLASEAPRLWTVSIAGNPLCTGTLPISCGSSQPSEWGLPACCHLLKTAAWHAFAMGQHRRLGGASGRCHVYLLPPPLMRKICAAMWRCTVTAVVAEPGGAAVASAASAPSQSCAAGQQLVPQPPVAAPAAGAAAAVEVSPVALADDEPQEDVPLSWEDDAEDSGSQTPDHTETRLDRGGGTDTGRSATAAGPARRSADTSHHGGRVLEESERARLGRLGLLAETETGAAAVQETLPGRRGAEQCDEVAGQGWEQPSARWQLLQRRCDCSCEAALYCVRIPGVPDATAAAPVGWSPHARAVRRKTSHASLSTAAAEGAGGFGHWNAVMATKVPATARAGATVGRRGRGHMLGRYPQQLDSSSKTSSWEQGGTEWEAAASHQHAGDPPAAPRLAAMFIDEPEQGRGDSRSDRKRRVILANLYEACEALHPPLSVEDCEDADADTGAGADQPPPPHALLLRFLGAALGMELADTCPTAAENEDLSLTLPTTPAKDSAAVAEEAPAGLNVLQQPLRLRLPSVCDISEAMRAYREGGEWRRVEEQQRHRHRQRAAEVAAARSAGGLAATSSSSTTTSGGGGSGGNYRAVATTLVSGDTATSAVPTAEVPGSILVAGAADAPGTVSESAHSIETAVATSSLSETSPPSELASAATPDAGEGTLLLLASQPSQPSQPSRTRFGERGATVQTIEDYSAFEEGELWQWRRHRDGVTGRLFYLNATTGEKRWRRPPRTITLHAAVGAGPGVEARAGGVPVAGAEGGGGGGGDGR